MASKFSKSQTTSPPIGKVDGLKYRDFYCFFPFSGQCIYPGKVTDADTFRIGNIGDLFPKDMDHLVVCIMKVLLQMEVQIPVQY